MIKVYTDSVDQKITDQIKEDSGRPKDLTGYIVTFNMREADSETLKIDNTVATIEDANNGQVSYTLQAADVDTQGEYYGWWLLTKGAETISTEETLIVIDTHAPGIRTTTGAIYRKLQGLIPLTISALRDSSEYGDRQIQDRIEEAKAMLLLPSAIPAAADEGELDLRVQVYLAKLTALEIIPAGVDYWMNQQLTVTTGGGTTTEIASYPDRIAALWKIYERLLVEVKQEAGLIDEILGTSGDASPSSARPEFLDAVDENFVTPSPHDNFRDYAFPGPRNRRAWGYFYGW